MPASVCPFPIIEAGPDRDLLANSVERVKAAVTESGGVLLRGFDVDVEAFSKFTKQFMTKPFVHAYKSAPKQALDDPKAREGFGPRIELTADRTVTTVNIGKAGVPLHGDASIFPMRPDIAAFSCVRPADSGGATTFADGTTIVEQLSAASRDFFANNRAKWQIRWEWPAWTRMLGVENDRDQIRAGIEQWKKLAESRGEAFRVFFRDERPELFAEFDEAHPNDTYFEYVTPFIPKRRDGRRAFCSHLLNSAWFNNELYGNAEHPEIKKQRLSSAETYAMFKRKTSDDSVVTEKGEVIPDEHLQALWDACEKVEYPMPWRPHDIVMIDNWRTPHGRHAYTDTKRSILTTFGYADWIEQVSPQ